MFRPRFIVPVLAIGLLTSGILMGQDKKKEKPTVVINVKLPAYYSKLGLDKKQRAEVLKVRAQYAAKIEELKQQINELKEKEAAELEKLLTEAQRTRLRELTPGGGKKTSEPKGKSSEIKKK